MPLVATPNILLRGVYAPEMCTGELEIFGCRWVDSCACVRGRLSERVAAKNAANIGKQNKETVRRK